jgi:hypothetical protein
MPLFEFLAEVMRRFGAVFAVDAWYFTAVQAIGFLPRDQIESIMRAYGHPVLEPVCGLTTMRHWPDTGVRDVPQIWIAEPDAVCPVSQLAFFVDHELHHVLVWLRDGLTVWPGHD